MATKSRAASPAASSKRPKRVRVPIPEPFQVVSSATVTEGGAEVKVPMLVLYGEWLKEAGFPIGAAAYLAADKQGEVAVQRLGLRVPRRLFIRRTPS